MSHVRNHLVNHRRSRCDPSQRKNKKGSKVGKPLEKDLRSIAQKDLYARQMKEWASRFTIDMLKGAVARGKKRMKQRRTKLDSFYIGERSKRRKKDTTALAAVEYGVDSVLDEREGDDGGREFLVRWDGYDSDEDSWEPMESLKDSVALSDFLGEHEDGSDDEEDV